MAKMRTRLLMTETIVHVEDDWKMLYGECQVRNKTMALPINNIPLDEAAEELSPHQTTNPVLSSRPDLSWEISCKIIIRMLLQTPTF
jgi:hypothetical protein